MPEPTNPLSYEAEGWLYKHNPTAWGYLKAMQHERNLGQVAKIKAILTTEVKQAIADAYKRSNA